MTLSDVKECARWNSCPVEMLEHTSNGYWMTIKFDEETSEFSHIKINSFIDDMANNGLQLCEKTEQIDSDGEEWYLYYELEFFY